ncbi:MAG: CHASE2 domain-containing protein [Bacteroidia bacterium]
MRKFNLVKEAAVASGVIALLTFLVNFLPFKFEFTKAIRQGLFGFDVYDLHFSEKHIKNDTIDSRIVLVEIGENRAEIAGQLEMLTQYNPKVIGVDAFLEVADTVNKLNDLRLQAILGQHTNIVLANKNEQQGSTIRNVPNIFHTPATHLIGYANFTGHDEYVVVRSYYPFYTLNGQQLQSFTSAIVRKYDTQHYDILKGRDNEDEIINFTSGLNNYQAITKDELVEYDSTQQLPSILKDKIVLLGYFVKDAPLVLKDLHFTPLNEKVVGKSYPDLYGIVIHANILSMILNGEYATMLSDFLSYLIAYLISFFILLIVLKLYDKKGHPNHGLLLLLQLFAISIVLYFFLLLFDITLIKVNLVPVVVGLY